MADCGTGESQSKFLIKPWGALQPITICGRCNAVDVLQYAGNGPTMQPIQSATAKAQYLQGVADVVARLKAQGGKTVISRTITLNCPEFDIAEVADKLFDAFEDAFCNLYYTAATGAWIGATPETLLHVGNNGHLATMALAGTIFDNRTWDEKNMREHRMVVDFISNVLSQANVKYSVGATTTLAYGRLTHLCTPFMGHVDDVAEARTIADRLSPTPAVAGLPRETALAEIATVEQHQRRCYAGYLAIDDAAGFRSYVNLRCAEFDERGHVCIYAGGGITGDSVPEDEWNESQAKAAALISIFNSHQ